jgi:DNA helicase-2/ATP-dependent DNA helicase PcrA
MNLLPQKTAWRYRSGIEELQNIHNRIARIIGRSNVGAIIRMIRKITDYDKYISKKSEGEGSTARVEKIENLDSLCEQAEHYADVEKFLADISKIIAMKEEKVQSKRNNENVNAVAVATSHKLKGMEFKNVFGISINDSLYPHYKAVDVGEELRNLYVLVSRAESGLYLSSTLWYSNKTSKPSKFLHKVFDKEMINKQVKMVNKEYKVGCN